MFDMGPFYSRGWGLTIFMSNAYLPPFTSPGKVRRSICGLILSDDMEGPEGVT